MKFRNSVHEKNEHRFVMKDITIVMNEDLYEEITFVIQAFVMQ